MMRTNLHPLRRDQGSVYILALLVLLILTVVGLSLSLVTQSEMQIGVNERLSHQAFHMSTAGIDIATAKALVMPDLRSFELDLVELGDVGLRFRVGSADDLAAVQVGDETVCVS